MTEKACPFGCPAIRIVAICLAMCGGASAAARQAIVANDPVVLPPPAASPKPADAPSRADSNPSSPAPSAAQRPLIEVAPAAARTPPAATAGLGGSAGDPAANAAAAPKPATESKPLGKPNAPLSARPIDESRAAGSGLGASLDPRNNEIVRMVLAIGAVVAALLLMRMVLRRMGAAPFGAAAGRPSGVIEVLARYPIARGQQLVLVKLARRIMLLHQSGSSMSTLSEMTDPDEVASLLARMEAGASGKNAAKFQATLSEFVQEHQALGSARPGRVRSLPRMETEVVDLTRGSSRGLGSLLGRKAAR